MSDNEDWRTPAGGLPHRWWDWNNPPAAYARVQGTWTESVTAFADAAARGILLLWCDDTIVPPLGQLVVVETANVPGRCTFRPIGPEYRVDEWIHHGRVLSYENAARAEFEDRLRGFILNPGPDELGRARSLAAHLHACEIHHDALSRFVMVALPSEKTPSDTREAARRIRDRLVQLLAE